jgi:hypothetical protein
MALKWKDKRNVCMLSSTHNDEVQTVHDKKGAEKQKSEVCIGYINAVGFTFLISTLCRTA